jgi:hypothetical protein
MSFDAGLAERIRDYFLDSPKVEEKRMFGGLCFMVSSHMCCGIVKDKLMARVGPANYEACLKQEHVQEMDFTGKAMKGMVYVSPEGLDADEALAEWLGICLQFVQSLPAKKIK